MKNTYKEYKENRISELQEEFNELIEKYEGFQNDNDVENLNACIPEFRRIIKEIRKLKNI